MTCRELLDYPCISFLAKHASRLSWERVELYFEISLWHIEKSLKYWRGKKDGSQRLQACEKNKKQTLVTFMLGLFMTLTQKKYFHFCYTQSIMIHVFYTVFVKSHCHQIDHCQLCFLNLTFSERAAPPAQMWPKATGVGAAAFSKIL